MNFICALLSDHVTYKDNTLYRYIGIFIVKYTLQHNFNLPNFDIFSGILLNAKLDLNEEEDRKEWEQYLA